MTSNLHHVPTVVLGDQALALPFLCLCGVERVEQLTPIMSNLTLLASGVSLAVLVFLAYIQSK